ncbi:MAG: site-specific DNA-methyltransferase [Nitrososphaeraceae archaeon]
MKNILFYGDNLEAMKYLIENGFENKIDLVYIDPPFLTRDKYFLRTRNSQELAFDDTFRGQNPIKIYLDSMYPRLQSIQHLLSPSGSIFIHLDWHMVHYVKVVMDELFGYSNFRNEIIIKRGRRKNLLYQFKSIDRMHIANDSILWYSKDHSARFSLPMTENTVPSKWMGFWSNVDRPTMRYNLLGYVPERGQWKWTRARALEAAKNYKIYERRFPEIPLEEYWLQTGKKLEFIRKRDGVKYAEYWIPPKNRTILDNVWLDVESYGYSTGYETEKHEQLLERIIGQFSCANGLIADFFCGSGTSLVVAARLARNWIGCDSSPQAIYVARQRLSSTKFKLIKLI